MKAVHCLEFSKVVKDAKTGKKFIPRKSPKRLSEVLVLKDCHVPDLSQDEFRGSLLIETHFAGIQYPDALQAQGLYQVKPPLPYVPGMDVSGVIVGIGADVNAQDSSTNPWKLGDRVMATLLQDGGTGGLAELVVAPVEHVYHISDRLPLQFCANIGRNYFAAYHSLKTIGQIHRHRHRNSSSNSPLVLVDGASGGVGMATIELAKAMGAHVIAGVSTPDKLSAPLSVGADHAICYGRTKKEHRNFKREVLESASDLGHPQGADLVVDMVQGVLFEAALVSCVRPLGTIALVGFAAGQRPIRPGVLLVKEVNVVGSLWGRWAMEFSQEHKENVYEILNFFSSGKIRPRVDRIFPLSNFHQAFHLFETNKGRGNTAIVFPAAETAKQPSRL